VSRIITALGVITALAFAVAPDLAQINSNLARYMMLVGVAAAAAGRALDPRALKALDPRRLRRGLPRRGAFASRVRSKLPRKGR
jgi:hypothetical protein